MSSLRPLVQKVRESTADDTKGSRKWRRGGEGGGKATVGMGGMIGVLKC